MQVDTLLARNPGFLEACFFLCRQIHPEMRENPTCRLQDAELFGQGAKASHYSYGSVIISPRGSMPLSSLRQLKQHIRL